MLSAKQENAFAFVVKTAPVQMFAALLKKKNLPIITAVIPANCSGRRRGSFYLPYVFIFSSNSGLDAEIKVTNSFRSFPFRFQPRARASARVRR